MITEENAKTGPDIAALRMVVEAVRGAPEEQFNIGSWDCGTSACAVGWFKRANPNDAIYFEDVGYTVKVRLRGRGDEFLSNSQAVATRFGISTTEAREMFLPMGYEEVRPSRAAVIARIEQFIAEHEAPS